jgi:hypothetical protein
MHNFKNDVNIVKFAIISVEKKGRTGKRTELLNHFKGTGIALFASRTEIIRKTGIAQNSYARQMHNRRKTTGL